MLSVVVVEEADEGIRLDVFLAKVFSISRHQAQRAVEEQGVLVNTVFGKKRYLVQKGDRVTYTPFLQKMSPLEPVKMGFEIIYEDEDLFVINKPPGLVVHPAPGHYEKTFVHGFLHHCRENFFEDSVRPGIVHRLDKDTSGVLIAAKNVAVLHAISKQFHDRTVQKEYIGICEGILEESCDVSEPIGRHRKHRQKMAVVDEGRSAHTRFVPIVFGQKSTIVSIRPTTGRTHQIRVHAAFIHHPICYDAVYGFGSDEKAASFRQMLHCYSIICTHPVTKKTLSLKAPIPPDMLAVMQMSGLIYQF